MTEQQGQSSEPSLDEALKTLTREAIRTMGGTPDKADTPEAVEAARRVVRRKAKG